MRINTKIRYGLRMLTLLAQKHDVFNTVELGEEMDVSPKYLRKLAGPLEKAGLLKSIQGVHGGYLIDRGPGQITLGMVFNAFGENTSLSRCLDTKKCPLYDECVVRPVWDHLGGILEREFQTISLKDILNRNFGQNKRT